MRKMNEIKSKNKSNHNLINGCEAHIFTNDERSRGGKVSTFGALKHGKYAKKLSQKYICPKCNTPITAGNMIKQDVILMKLTKKEDIYEEIKKNLVLIKQLTTQENDSRVKFGMLLKGTDQLIKLIEKKDFKENTDPQVEFANRLKEVWEERKAKIALEEEKKNE